MVNIILKNGEAGKTYSSLFRQYITESHWIKIIDPFIRKNYQFENVKHLLSLVANPGECRSHLITQYDNSKEDDTEDILREKLDELTKYFQMVGLYFTYEFQDYIHDRMILTEKFKIQLGRGLDIFYFDRNDRIMKTRESEITIFPIQ